MKKLKKLLAIILIISITAVSLPLTALAYRENDEYIYISDIYYAYPTYISKTNTLRNYSEDTLECLYVTLDHYLNSDSFADTTVKTIFENNPGNIIDYIQMFLSGTFGPNYVKSDAIDIANELFVQNMFNTNSVECAQMAEALGERIIPFCEACEEYAKYTGEFNLTAAEVIKKGMDILVESGILTNVSSDKINNFISKVMPELGAISSIASIGGDMIKLGKTLMLAVMLEDFRLNIISDILSETQHGTTLYEGMNRLYNDISSDFGTYVFNNYIVNGLLEKLADKVVDKISDAILGNYSLVLSVVGATFKILAGVFLSDTPNLNDIMLQMVLTDYVNELQNVVYRYDNRFEEEEFYSEDIRVHKNLVSVLQTLTYLALEKTKPLAVYQSDLYELGHLINTYSGGFDLYDSIISEVRNKILSQSYEERDITFHESWTITQNTTFALGTDKPENDKIYCTNGVFNGNIAVPYNTKLIVPEDLYAAVNGTITLQSNYSTIENNGNFTVTGDIISSGGDSYTKNNGNLTVCGNADFHHIVMNSENTTLTVGGNLSIHSSRSDITNGTVILNGTTQQTLQGLSCHNLIVNNTAGIKYLSPVYVTGDYLLNGNPLDNNGYYAVVCSEDVYFDSISDYKEIQLGSDLNLSNKVKSNFTLLYNTALVIPAESTAIIDGNLTSNNMDTWIELAGKLTVTGDICTSGNLSMYEESAVLTVAGNLTIYNNNCDITNGTVILNGTMQQTLHGLFCHNLIVNNSAGIKYLNHVYVTGEYFLNGNPLDNNGCYTHSCFADVFFDSVSDYKEIFISENLTVANSIKANITIPYNKTLTLAEDATGTIDGNITLMSNYSTLENNGNFTVTGDIISPSGDSYTKNHGNLTVCGNADFKHIVMNSENTTLTVGGNLNISYKSEITNGTVILNGTTQQTLQGLSCHNLIVNNTAGIKYLSPVYVTGDYLLNGNPLDNNEYYAVVCSEDVYFDSVSDYKEIQLGSDLNLSNKVKGNFTLLYNTDLVIPTESTAIIDGNLTATNNASWIEIAGKLTVTGNIDARALSMHEESAVLKVAGNLSINEKSDITNGTVILNGNTQQTLYRLSCHNLIVNNSAGIKYLNHVYVTGEYFLNGNPLDNNGCYTYSCSADVFFDSVSDYKEIFISENLTVANSIKANITIPYNKTLTLAENTTGTIDGNITLMSNYSTLENNGNFTVTGDIISPSGDSYTKNYGNLTVCGNANFIHVVMSGENTTLTVKGNLYIANKSDITNGTVILNGTSQQNIHGLSCHNLIVNNSAGIKYSTSVYVTGDYFLNGNPLDNNGKHTVVSSEEVLFDSISDYKEIQLNSDLPLSNKVKGNFTLSHNTDLVIQTGSSATIDGNITATNTASWIEIAGKLTVTGNITARALSMHEESAVLKVAGNINIQYDSLITNGAVILNGTTGQTVNRLIAPTIVLENKSDEGVTFRCSISPSVLFNHNGNKFTLHNNGNGSKFADYDKDLVTDEKDDNPTVFSAKNYCETLCDVTSNGKTDVIDFISIKKNISSGKYSESADLNNDGAVNALDTVILKKVLLGIYDLVNQ